MLWWPTYFIIAAGAAVITAVFTPACRYFSWKLDILDKPLGEFHKKHDAATPLLGGLALLAGWTATIFVGVWLILISKHHLPPPVSELVPGIRSVLPLLYVITAGAVALTCVGLIDDWKPMGPFVKLLLQLLICAAVAAYPKIRITVFISTPFVTWAITTCWFMLIINAFNFFDNMDGLASGIALIAAMLFTLVAVLRCQYLVGALGAVTAGTAFGFYLYNRYPASIFMGDSGSHFLGYILAVIGALTLFYQPESSPTVAPLLIPILVMAVPIFDAFAVIVIRFKSGNPIYYGDHNHISHRFHHMGLDRETSVFLVHLLSLTIGLGAVTLLWLETKGAVIVIVQSTAILTLVTVLHTNNSRRISRNNGNNDSDIDGTE